MDVCPLMRVLAGVFTNWCCLFSSIYLIQLALSYPFPPSDSISSLAFLYLSSHPFHTTCFSLSSQSSFCYTSQPPQPILLNNFSHQINAHFLPHLYSWYAIPRRRTTHPSQHFHLCMLKSSCLLCICSQSLTSVHHCTPHTCHTHLSF